MTYPPLSDDTRGIGVEDLLGGDGPYQDHADGFMEDGLLFGVEVTQHHQRRVVVYQAGTVMIQIGTSLQNVADPEHE